MHFIVYGGTLTHVYAQNDLSIDFTFPATIDNLYEVVMEAEAYGEGNNWVKIVELELPEL